jgi:hypothetical protein
MKLAALIAVKFCYPSQIFFFFLLSPSIHRLFFAVMAKFSNWRTEAEGFRKPGEIKPKLN